VEPGTGDPIALRSDAARGATFAELRSRWTNHLFLKFGLTWDDAAEPVTGIEIALLDLAPRIRRQVVERLQAWGVDAARLLDVRWSLPDSDNNKVTSKYVALQPDGRREVQMSFDGLIPDALAPSGNQGGGVGSIESVIGHVRTRLASLGSSIHWLASVRALPPRRSVATGPMRRLQPDGSGAVDVLAYDQDHLGNGPVMSEVAAWYSAATGHRLELKREAYGPSEQFYLALSPLRSTPVPIHILDTGEGMAQVLPVIVLAALAKHGRLGKNPVLTIEQPELHLHPRAHAEVAAFFCDLARAPEPPRTLIETHSENLLLRIQLEIVRGQLSPDLVVVYWVRQMDDGRSVVERITFDDLGRPENATWPPGVFSEDIEQARAIALERRKRRDG
jgi:hypothetical protein